MQACADQSHFSQGYALIEFNTVEEAKAAIEGTNGTKLLDQTIAVDFAFVRPPPNNQGRGRGGGVRDKTAAAAGGRNRARSRSPEADKGAVE